MIPFTAIIVTFAVILNKFTASFQQKLIDNNI